MTRRNIRRPEFVYDNLDTLPELVKAEGSSAKLAKKAGIHPDAFSNYARGFSLPSMETYNKLAEYFGWRLWE
ncbi:MAG: helix-turn-helix transcriptional regulator [Synergistaceae bacterium]|nr:helix-turn-helix transcriptional regulator [Synergistaceae bacterium]